jgi:uncharacterized RDD family membrane protein YckC
MKKQILYPKFITRLFAATVDLSILTLINTLIFNFISYYCFIFLFRDFFELHHIDMYSNDVVKEVTAMVEFKNYMEQIGVSRALLFWGIKFFIDALCMGLFFVGFWKYKGATPGKMLMRTKIVDATTLEKPTTWQLIKRFFGYFTALFGMWFILFSRRGQALHDKMSNTLVIKV